MFIKLTYIYNLKFYLKVKNKNLCLLNILILNINTNLNKCNYEH